MDISYGDKAVEELCINERKAKKAIGRNGFRKLRARLADCDAAANVSQLVAGRPHPLKGDRAGQFSLELDGGRRLVFEPASQPVPRRPDGGISWEEVTAIRIIFIGDYHE